MNIMNEKIKVLTENIANGYIKLNDVAEDIDIEDLKKGREILQDTRRIQEEFFPLSDNSEEIIVTLLSQNFVYDKTDYSNEIIDSELLKYSEIGLLLYVLTAFSDKVVKLNNTLLQSMAEDDF